MFDTLKALFSYAWALNLKYRVEFVDMLMNDIVDDFLLSYQSPTRTPAIYRRFIRLANPCIDDSAFLPLLERLSREAREGE